MILLYKVIKKFTTLIFFVIAVFIVGFAGSYFTTPYIPLWYAGLTKPPLTPPNVVFGPVWSFLYLLIGISGWIVWEKTKDLKPLFIYVIQLGLNFAWSYVFFANQNPKGALLIIILLILAVVWNILEFSKFERKAAYLLVPYLVWISFATYLNLGVYLLN